MLELAAFGSEPDQHWRRAMPAEGSVRIGRAPVQGWAVPWDTRISREHADVRVENNTLSVRCLDSALNPAYLNEEPERQFTVQPGEGFRIGSTSFKVFAMELSGGTDGDVQEHAYQSEEIRQFVFRNAEHKMEVLWHLPSVISAAMSDEEFGLKLVRLLLEGIPHAQVAAVAHYSTREDEDTSKPLMMRWEARSTHDGRFFPSRRLITKTLERRETILHIWTEDDEDESKFTISDNLDWAICCPLRERAGRGWCIYVTGKLTFDVMSADDLQGDVRFIELIANMVSAIRQVRTLERQQAGMMQFFSPSVLNTLSDSRADSMLAPREADTTVLFCDLRGFSKRAEQSQGNLAELLKRCSEALGIMTRGILEYNGTIADFQGDAALGFWGWPVRMSDGPLPACRAALKIQAAFQRAQKIESHPLAEFRVGIGIAHGRAIAGKIGTDDQAKVGVFGPVVNLAARLESMTKQLRVPILLDEETSNYLREHASQEELRLRTLGRVRPYGMDTPVTVSQLLAPFDEDDSISAENIATYEQAVECLNDGRWSESLELLNSLPVYDRAKDFLMIFIALNQYEPSSDWDGVIEMLSK